MKRNNKHNKCNKESNMKCNENINNKCEDENNIYSQKKKNKKCEEEPKYNVGPKLELKALFILLLGFFLGLRVVPPPPPNIHIQVRI